MTHLTHSSLLILHMNIPKKRHNFRAFAKLSNAETLKNRPLPPVKTNAHFPENSYRVPDVFGY